MCFEHSIKKSVSGSSLQQSLMDLQQQQLTELDAWLGEMEDRIEQFNNTIHRVDTLENVKK